MIKKENLGILLLKIRKFEFNIDFLIVLIIFIL